MLKKISIFFLGISIFCFGLLVGMVAEKIAQSEEKQAYFSEKNFEKNKVPTLLFEKIENGKIFGENLGSQVRIAVKNSEISVLENENFSLDIVEIFPMAKKIPHPEGKNFVASKRGKNFWPLDSPQAFLITPKNRIFFETSSQAQESGFQTGR